MGADDVAAAVKTGATRATSRLSFVECGAAFARADRDGRVSRADATTFNEEFEATWQDIALVELDDEIARRAVTIVRDRPLRASDAIHLASALAVSPPSGDITFACYDRRLGEAARGLGFETIPVSFPVGA